MTNQLALGTAQFGLPYGIANRVGQVSCEEASAIMDQAWGAGIDTLDTAIAYGRSEQLLGEIGVGQWRVISKLPTIPEDGSINVAAWVLESVHNSLKRLRIPRLRGLLLHRSQQLLGPRGDILYRAMTGLKDQGKVEKIGVSIYGPDELDALWPHYQLDLVQGPLNVVDRRLVTSGWLARLHHAGTEVHIRSVFLQGLLLMKPTNRPATFNRWQSLWQEWHRWVADQSLTPLQACTGFALSHAEINRVVVGVDSLNQLKEILASVKGLAVPPPAALMREDPDLINPSRWNGH